MFFEPLSNCIFSSVAKWWISKIMNQATCCGYRFNLPLHAGADVLLIQQPFAG